MFKVLDIAKRALSDIQLVIPILRKANCLHLMLGAAGVGLSLAIVEFAFAVHLNKTLIELGVIQKHSALNSDPNTTILFVLIVLVLVRACLKFLEAFIRAYITGRFRFRLRSEILQKSLFSPHTSEKHSLASFSHHADQGSLLVDAFTNFVISALICTTLFGLLAYLSLELFVLTMIASLLLLIPISWIKARSSKIGETVSASWRRSFDRLITVINNAFVLRLYGQTAQEMRDGQAELNRYFSGVTRFKLIAVGVPVLIESAAILLLCLVFISSSRLVESPAAVLLPFTIILVRLFQSGSQALEQLTNVAYGRPHLQNALSWLESSGPEVSNGEGPPKKQASQSKTTPPALLVKNLTFSYPNSSTPVIQGASFNFPAGRVSCITGESGAGKTSLLKLLCGDLRPDSGQVIIKGPDFECDAHSFDFSNMISYLPAEPSVFEGSIRENLHFASGRPLSEPEMHSALEMACCQFIFSRPCKDPSSKLDLPVGDLSTGEKQRICLARALARKPRLLILDEFTAHLDAETEADVLEQIATLKERSTVVLTAHRASVQAIADTLIRLP